jgi:phenylacetate-CoA ligase
LPFIDEIVGRVADVFYTADGREIGAIDTAFPAHFPVREAQIIQEDLGCVKVRYVPAPDYTESAGQSLVDEIRARMGPIDVALERVSELPRGPNGKLHAVVCSIRKPRMPEVSITSVASGAESEVEPATRAMKSSR